MSEKYNIYKVIGNNKGVGEKIGQVEDYRDIKFFMKFNNIESCFVGTDEDDMCYFVIDYK